MTNLPSSDLMPLIGDLTDNERAWVGFIRLISNDTDPAPTLARVQGVRLALLGKSGAS
jgi:hypothetical protein